MNLDTHIPASARVIDPPQIPPQGQDDFSKPALPPPGSLFQSLPDLVNSLKHYFSTAQKFRTVTDTVTSRETGDITETVREIPCAPPSFLQWCQKNKMKLRDLRDLALRDQDVRDAVEEAYLTMREFVIENGLTGRYDTKFAQFYLTAEFKMITSLGEVTINVNSDEEGGSTTLKKKKKYKQKSALSTVLDALEQTNN